MIPAESSKETEFPNNSAPILELREISKAFGGVQALTRVNLSVLPGEIHSLVGENGAGKSTLVKILAGAYVPDSGVILLNETKYETLTPKISQLTGIAVVYQEFNLLLDLTVAENVFLGRLPRGRFGTVSPKESVRRATEIFERLGSNLDPRRYVSELSVVEQQLVEIAKALAFDARCIILDEPSTVLSPEEIKTLHDVLRRLKSERRSIIYITHRLQEVFELADRVTVFKDGQLVSSNYVGDVSEDDLIQRMVGRPISELFPQSTHSVGDPVLVVRELNVAGKLFDVSLTVHRGEILGVAGLGGSGRTTLARTLVGLERVASGRVSLDGSPVPHSPGPCARAGLVMVPEDRKAHGILGTQSVAANLALPSLRRVSWCGILSFQREVGLAKRLITQFRIRPTSVKTDIQNLSGGNQQKVVLAKWFDTSPKLVVLDEPTRGVDVGAKAEIYSIIEGLRKSGVGVLLASSDLAEVLGTCDRIVVLREGKVSATLQRNEATEETIMRAAVSSGGSHNISKTTDVDQTRAKAS